MAGKGSVTCAKCGITSKEDPFLSFHRFPRPSKRGSLKARVWAKFCYPDNDWTSDESLEKLYAQHKMLCDNHFDDSSYTSSSNKRLNKFAIPTEARNILSQLRDEQCTMLKEAQITQYPVASTSKCSDDIVESETQHRYAIANIAKYPVASTSKCPDNIVESETQHRYAISNIAKYPVASTSKCSDDIMESETQHRYAISNIAKYPVASTSKCPDDIMESETQHCYAIANIAKYPVASTSKCPDDIMESETQHRYAISNIAKYPVASTSKCPDAILESETQRRYSSPDITKESQKRKGILKDLNLKSCELTPRKHKLYKRCRKNLCEIIRLRKKLQKVKKSDRSILESLTSNSSVNEILKSKLSSSFYLLLQSQLRNLPRKLTGRRWTLDDKVLALSIYKKSRSCYRLLSYLFCLPSVSSLKELLNKIPLVCGINNQVVTTIQKITKNRIIDENLCMLAFDEMSIRKNLTYNSKLDQLDGYQDHSNQGRSSEIASHALTFMAIGVRKPWKQPMAFYFSGSCVTADRLAVLIKEVLSACFCAGLEVIGTVCDLDGVNIRAINSLGSSTEHPYFYHEGHEIVTILDPPHLLKCFRNNFLKHDIQFTQDTQIEGRRNQGIAKWSYIEEFYNIDRNNPNFVFAPALTQQHLQPNGKQKMKVKLAAQVLSHSVAGGIFAKAAQNDLPQDATCTATIVSNMDKLFDCMNGDTPDKKRGKTFLTNMSATSPHLDFFAKMRTFFREMKFLGARSKPPSQDGWLRTLNAVERIYNNLKETYGINTLSVRRLNQDPLENCFGCIRNNCGSNPNPTSVQFIAALKTSIITNLINNNKGRNCLDDNNDILNDFKTFLSQKGNDNVISSTPSTPYCDNILTEGVEEIDLPQCSGEMQACAYVCGFIVKRMALNCLNCKNIMLADQNTEVCHLFTSFKEYEEMRASLKYVKYSFCHMVENAAILINNYLKENAYKEKIKYNLFNICQNLDKDWLSGCEEHLDINTQNIINSTIAICLKRFCKIKNREFIEEASQMSLKRKINILKHI